MEGARGRAPRPRDPGLLVLPWSLSGCLAVCEAAACVGARERVKGAQCRQAQHASEQASVHLAPPPWRAPAGRCWVVGVVCGHRGPLRKVPLVSGAWLCTLSSQLPLFPHLPLLFSLSANTASPQCAWQQDSPHGPRNGGWSRKSPAWSAAPDRRPRGALGSADATERAPGCAVQLLGPRGWPKHGGWR